MREYLHIEFDREDRTYRFGETVSGKVLISSPRGDQCEVVLLRRFWRTHGRGNVEEGQPEATRLHSGPLSTEQLHEFRFEFSAPPGPYTYHGHFLNVDHYVEVQVDLPWARDSKQVEEYVLLPGKPVAPTPSLLEVAESPAEKLIPGCSAAIGSIVVVVGVIAFFSSGPVGLLFLLVGGFLFLPSLRFLAKKKLGESASAYLSSLVVAAGEEVEVEVRVAPPKQVQLNRAYVELKAEEICISGSDSKRRYHRHKVFSDIVQLSGPVMLEGGAVKIMKGSVQVPEGSPNSFKGNANRLRWEATVWLDIPSWPDWVKKIPFVVWPREDLLPKVEEPEALPASPEEPMVPEIEPIPEARTGAWVEVLPEVEPEIEPKPETEPISAARTGPGIEVLSEPDLQSEMEPEPEPEVEVFSEPEADPIVEGKADGSTGSLNEAVQAILDANLFGGGKDLLIKNLMGSAFEITLDVVRVDRSFGAFSRSEYRNGQTVTGRVAGSDLEVAIFFPEERNEEVRGWEPGSSHSVRGEVKDWDRLRKRPELLAKG